MVCACKPNTMEVGTGRPKSQSYPWLCKESEASLGYITEWEASMSLLLSCPQPLFICQIFIEGLSDVYIRSWEYNGESNRQNLYSPETQTSVGKRVAIYIKQMEKPTTGSAQTQKSTGKVASKGEQGKTEKQAETMWWGGRRSRLEEHSPSRRSLGVSVFVPPSHIYTQGFTLSHH